jgi:hypothetical protein
MRYIIVIGGLKMYILLKYNNDCAECDYGCENCRIIKLGYALDSMTCDDCSKQCLSCDVPKLQKAIAKLVKSGLCENSVDYDYRGGKK